MTILSGQTNEGPLPLLDKVKLYYLSLLATPDPHRALHPEYRMPDGKVKAFYTSPKVLIEGMAQGWADPEDPAQVDFSQRTTFVSNGVILLRDHVPQNPYIRSELPEGRGLLGKWGPNLAADALITTVHEPGGLFLLAIRRRDTGLLAFPGGMMDKGELPVDTCVRELQEEAGIGTSQLARDLRERSYIVYQGFGDDPRNTRNAWTETTVFHRNETYDRAMSLPLTPGDDASAAQWVVMTPETIMNLYSDHKYYMAMAMARLIDRGLLDLVSYRDVFAAIGLIV